VHWDAEQARRWAGHAADPARPLPSDLIGGATAADQSLLEAIRPFLAMRALPASLDPLRPRVREIYASGWRPPVPEGPTRDELAELVTASLAAAR